MTGPYLLLAKIGLLLAILAVPTCIGYKAGDKHGVKSQQPKIEALTKANDILKSGLANAGVALRDISARTKEEAAKAKLQQAQGAEAVAQAKQEKQASERRVSALRDELNRERSTCTEAEVKICGLPLR